ncbi:odorant receptor 46a-like [Neodiprion virginianus]|uniref:odorant receptor 46a-like n=1 Tax=Neodiprion virginianus TaxID=2961670 RepID=UPI001EE7612F|nr:odorant receptor 46a-like [Neodiprion virginianus]
MSLIFVVLTWFAAARFDILNTEIERASNLNEVNRCVRHHQESLKFASRLSETVGRTALAVAASNFAAVMFGGVVITFRQFYSLDFVKVVVIEMVSVVHLFLYAWPADYMAQLSQRVSESVLHGQWLGKSPKMQRSVLIMMQRANDPVIIKVDGLLPALNLETFGVGLSTSFSYIATLLAIFDE